MTQSKPTTQTTRLKADREAQDRAKRIDQLNQQLIEKSLEQHLAALNRLDGWMASPWFLSGLGVFIAVALISFSALFFRFLLLTH